MADYIYCITNKITGQKYIGRSIRPMERLVSHFEGNGSGKLKAALAEYGAENFTWQIIEEAKDVLQGSRREISLISDNGSFVDGYNSNRGGSIGSIGVDLHYAAKANKEYSKRQLERAKMYAVSNPNGVKCTFGSLHLPEPTQGDIAKLKSITQLTEIEGISVGKFVRLFKKGKLSKQEIAMGQLIAMAMEARAQLTKVNGSNNFSDHFDQPL